MQFKNADGNPIRIEGEEPKSPPISPVALQKPTETSSIEKKEVDNQSQNLLNNESKVSEGEDNGIVQKKKSRGCLKFMILLVLLFIAGILGVIGRFSYQTHQLVQPYLAQEKLPLPMSSQLTQSEYDSITTNFQNNVLQNNHTITISDANGWLGYSLSDANIEGSVVLQSKKDETLRIYASLPWPKTHKRFNSIIEVKLEQQEDTTKVTIPTAYFGKTNILENKKIENTFEIPGKLHISDQTVTYSKRG